MMAFEDESRSIAKRTAALTVLLNYLRPKLPWAGGPGWCRIVVQAAAQSHPVWKEGSRQFSNAQRADILKLFDALRRVQFLSSVASLHWPTSSRNGVRSTPTASATADRSRHRRGVWPLPMLSRDGS
jgi:hypothetical protein